MNIYDHIATGGSSLALGLIAAFIVFCLGGELGACVGFAAATAGLSYPFILGFGYN